MEKDVKDLDKCTSLASFYVFNILIQMKKWSEFVRCRLTNLKFYGKRFNLLPFFLKPYYLCFEKIHQMTITISNQVESSKYEKLLKFLYRERIAFSFEPTPSPQESSRTVSEEDLAIRERLRAKYVVSGQWANMNIDEKEDAALLETMLYDREKGIEILTPTEQTAFLNELRELAKLPEYANETD